MYTSQSDSRNPNPILVVFREDSTRLKQLERTYSSRLLQVNVAFAMDAIEHDPGTVFTREHVEHAAKVRRRLELFDV